MRDELPQERRVPETLCLSPDGRPLRVGFMPREAAFFAPSAWGHPGFFACRLERRQRFA